MISIGNLVAAVGYLLMGPTPLIPDLPLEVTCICLVHVGASRRYMYKKVFWRIYHKQSIYNNDCIINCKGCKTSHIKKPFFYSL